MIMTPWIILCALHASVCDRYHNRAAWPLPSVVGPMACVMSAQMAAPHLAIRPLHNLRYGDDRVVLLCVVHRSRSA